jgi:hypothetical protein
MITQIVRKLGNPNIHCLTTYASQQVPKLRIHANGNSGGENFNHRQH